MNDTILAGPKSISIEGLLSLQTLDLDEIASIAEAELLKLQSINGGLLWASDSPNFKYAFFGRDTTTVVENLAARVEFHKQSCAWLISLARYQGEKTVTKSDERRGALPHEIRSIFMEGQEVDEKAKEIFYQLRPRWSEDPETDTIVYYGELDGPARFVRACMALSRNGVDLTQQTFIHKNGDNRNLMDACNLAVIYINDRIDESNIGLVELQPPENPETLTNQTLKDSIPAYLHSIDGKPVIPNRYGPRAPLEAQLLCYEALVEFADIVEVTNYDKAYNMRNNAAKLKSNTLKHFMIVISDNNGTYQYLAAMIDRHPISDLPRRLNTIMSDAAEGMYGSFFSGEDQSSISLRHKISRLITSNEFLTNGGIRCRAMRDSKLFGFAEYHGSLSNWIVVTHTIAKGMHRQGYSRVAKELWTRMLCSMTVAGQFQEFCYFDEHNRLLLPHNDTTGTASWILSAEENSQQNQAWSISAALEATQLMSTVDLENNSPLEREFEDEILSTMQQYRHDPSSLIVKLRKDMQIYQLDQVKQLAGAHEVDITSIRNDARILRPVA